MRLALLAGLALAATPALAGDRVAIRLSFDPAAAQALAARGEKVVVSAWFYGEPASRSASANEVGLVDLSRQELTVEPRDQVVTLAEVPAAALARATEPYLNVNVFTARLTDENNLLDCGIVDDALEAVAGRDNVIGCRLLD